MRSPTSSMKKIRAELLRRGRQVSNMTVSRRLSKEFNLKSYKLPKKQRLMPTVKNPSVYSLLITISIGPSSNGGKVLFFLTNRPSNSLWFESGTSVDQLENVLMTDRLY